MEDKLNQEAMKHSNQLRIYLQERKEQAMKGLSLKVFVLR